MDIFGYDEKYYHEEFIKLVMKGKIKKGFSMFDVKNFDSSHKKVIKKERSWEDGVCVMIYAITAMNVQNAEEWKSYYAYKKIADEKGIPCMILITRSDNSNIVPGLKQDTSLIVNDNYIAQIRSIAHTYSSVNPAYIHFVINYHDKDTVDLHYNYLILRSLECARSLAHSFINKNIQTY